MASVEQIDAYNQRTPSRPQRRAVRVLDGRYSPPR
jgi:hypothetical protein